MIPVDPDDLAAHSPRDLAQLVFLIGRGLIDRTDAEIDNRAAHSSTRDQKGERTERLRNNIHVQYGVSHSMISMIRAGKRWIADPMPEERFKTRPPRGDARQRAQCNKPFRDAIRMALPAADSEGGIESFKAPKGSVRWHAKQLVTPGESDEQRDEPARLICTLIRSLHQRVIGSHWALQCQAPWPLAIVDELEFGRLQHRQVSWVGTLEDIPDINSDLAEHVCNVGAVAHQQAGLGRLTIRTTCRQPVARCQRRKLSAAAAEESVGSDEKGVCLIACNGRKSCLDFLATAGV
jgi:hypothetical protein